MSDRPLPLTGQRFHLVGVAGRGMAPLAVVARRLGAHVTGCDRGGIQENRDYLARQGFAYDTAHSVEHLDLAGTMVITPVAAGLPEAVAARDAGLLWHRTDLMAHVLRTRPSAGVTGSHGKGTVAALTAAALAGAGLDPLAIVGAPVRDFGGATRLGAGPIVAEVDDSDGTLRIVDTEVAVVTNLDDDHPHLDTTLRDQVEAVGEYVARGRRRVVLGPSPRAAELAAYAEAEVWRYGHDFSARVLATDAEGTRLRLHGPDGARVDALVRLLSARVGPNAAVAFATALALGAEPEAAAAGLSGVTSISRRLDRLGVRDGVVVVDDFGGKHPVNVRAGIAALRRHYPRARVVAVFQPYGPFLARFGRRYARALAHADEVVLVPPKFSADYDAGAAFDPDWAAGSHAHPVHVGSELEGAAAGMELAAAGDVLVFFAQTTASRVMAETAVEGGAAP